MELLDGMAKKDLVRLPNHMVEDVIQSITGMLKVLNEIKGKEEWEKAIYFQHDPTMEGMYNNIPRLEKIVNDAKTTMIERFFGNELIMS